MDFGCLWFLCVLFVGRFAACVLVALVVFEMSGDLMCFCVLVAACVFVGTFGAWVVFVVALV